MHATSKNMKDWKKLPDDTFYAGDNYSKNDFRDPYVLYNKEEGQYWMLVSTRNEKTGVIAKYTSKDLKTWKDEGVFFENDMDSDSNMECSSLIKYKGKWYLAFSDQWPNKQVHYRVSDKMSGPFEKPKDEVFDGNGFYAGRLESDGDNLYVFGWNPTKNQHVDSEEYNWAGNLVVHQLKQNSKGDLYPVLNEKIEKKLSKKLDVTPVLMTKTVKMDENNYTFSGDEYEVVKFDKLLGSYRIESTISNYKKN
jgi:beta-fructofuranosidase